MSSASARSALTALTAVGAIGVGAAVWGTCIERYLFTVRRHIVPVLPAGSPSLRVLHLSDAHMAPWQHRKQRWIADLADRLQPDFVVNTGDNTGHLDGLDGLRRAFGPLRGVPGVFVHGSNDVDAPKPRNPLKYFTGPSAVKHKAARIDTDALDGFLNGLGWRDLNNAAAGLDVAGIAITAFGVDDAHRDWDRLDLVPDAIAEVDREGAVRFGVTHAPYRFVLDEFTDLGADMLFAGHTHGGQVRIPFSPDALVANCDIPLDQARGMSTWTHRGRTVQLNVSAGLGHSIYAPVRFACRPEASLLVLTARG